MNSFDLMQDLFCNVGVAQVQQLFQRQPVLSVPWKKGDPKNGVFTYSISELMKANCHNNYFGAK